MRRARVLLVICVLLIAIQAPAAPAQVTTPTPGFGVSTAISPVDLYDRLLTTPFPSDLLLPGVAALEPYEWRDSNDADLAGSVGGVIFADGDPFASELPTAITYVVFPDTAGPQAPLAAVAEAGEPTELIVAGHSVPAIHARLEGVDGHFAAVDNVLLYGMAPSGEDAKQVSAALAEAAIEHLVAVAMVDEATAATPASAEAPSATDAFLALAAAPFPAGDLPFAVGSLVVLPMSMPPQESASGMERGLLVRDADRTYPYPLVKYQFYADDSTARDAVSAVATAPGVSSVAELPAAVELPYPATLVDRTDDTTEVLVQVGATIVIGNAPSGALEDRHNQALTLAQIAVSHLTAVAGSDGTPVPV